MWYLAEGAKVPMTRLVGKQGWSPGPGIDPVFIDLDELFSVLEPGSEL